MVLSGLERRSAEISSAMARSARERVPEIARVAALDADLPRRLDLMCTAHVQAFIQSARAGHPPDAAELAFMRELGARRSRELFPLEALMHGLRAGQQVLWNEIVAEAGPTADGQSAALALTAHLIDYTDAVGRELERSYIAEQQQRAALSVRARQALLEDALAGRLFASPDGASRAFAAGLEADADYLVAAVGLGRAAPPEAIDSLRATCERLASPSRRSPFVASRAEEVIVVVATAKVGDVRQLLKSAASAVTRTHARAIVAGIGGPCRGVSQLPQACEAALLALRHARRTGGVLVLDDLGVVEYLAGGADPTAHRLGRRHTDPLTAEQERRGNALIHTFPTYIDCDMNVVQTAAALGLHPNTIRHRLDRIESVTGLDTRCVRDAMELAAAIELLHGQTRTR
jgi:PucR C-terminal helix-turn-helix domain/GGDEF-like domain